jgi:hypothetical protein
LPSASAFSPVLSTLSLGNPPMEGCRLDREN